VGAVENQFWKTLCRHLKFPQYESLQYDEEKKEEIIEAFRKAFLQKTMAQWELEFSQMDVCVSAIHNLDEVMEAPLFKERDMVVEFTGIDGKPEKVLGIPVKLSKTPGAIRTPSISFGANTKAILREYGYTDDQISQFSNEDII